MLGYGELMLLIGFFVFGFMCGSGFGYKRGEEDTKKRFEADQSKPNR